MPMSYIKLKTKMKLCSMTKMMKLVVYIRALNMSSRRKKWSSLVSLLWALQMWLNQPQQPQSNSLLKRSRLSSLNASATIKLKTTHPPARSVHQAQAPLVVVHHLSQVAMMRSLTRIAMNKRCERETARPKSPWGGSKTTIRKKLRLTPMKVTIVITTLAWRQIYFTWTRRSKEWSTKLT